MTLAQYSDLPDELIVEILPFVHPGDLESFAYVSRRNYNISSNAFDIHRTRKTLYWEHNSYPIEIKLLGVDRRAESFVKDKVTHTWKNERFKIENMTLVKVIGSKKAAAKYSQKTGRDKEGVLVVDTGEVGELVAVSTCVAILQHKDSFSNS